jgi:hypothetical protein
MIPLNQWPLVRINNQWILKKLYIIYITVDATNQ